TPANGQGSHPCSAEPVIGPARRGRMAGWEVQRGRYHDGPCAAAPGRFGHPGGISATGRLYRPRPGPTGVPARLCGTACGLHRAKAELASVGDPAADAEAEIKGRDA